MDSENFQKGYYNNILYKYDAHHHDKFSQKYRERFINKWLFGGINVKGKKILEAMCGSGGITRYLLSAGAEVTGLDISDVAIKIFREYWPDCNFICGSILQTKIDDNSFDCVVVVGGLHHVCPHLNEAVMEIHRILKKGGFLCFVEPHKGSLPDFFRGLWYKCDTFFMENETSIDLDGLKKRFSAKFKIIKERYGGNVAYLLIMNSMIFRVPFWLKSIYSPVLLVLESITQPLMRKKLSCFVIAQWQKI